MRQTEVRSVNDIRAAVGEAEWAARVDLAACYRLVALYGMTDLIYNHISAQVPGHDDQYLINPYGMLYEEITASSLVKIDLSGNKVDDSPWDVNPAGFTIHSAIHAARADANCVIHTHSMNGTAVSAQEHGVLPLTQHASFILASLGYHDYEGVALLDDEKPRLVRDLGDNRYLMLRNHGLLTVGRTVGEAFVAMYMLEAACAMQLRALSGGTALRPIDVATLATAGDNWDRVTRGIGGEIAWPALLRKLDRISPGYRD